MSYSPTTSNSSSVFSVFIDGILEVILSHVILSSFRSLIKWNHTCMLPSLCNLSWEITSLWLMRNLAGLSARALPLIIAYWILRMPPFNEGAHNRNLTDIKSFLGGKNLSVPTPMLTTVVFICKSLLGRLKSPDETPPRCLVACASTGVDCATAANHE